MTSEDINHHPLQIAPGLCESQANLVLDGKMLGKGDGSPDTAETLSRVKFCTMIYNDYR